ncbi:uncharacterized protein LOC123507575 [Portunus trituberculatus]|uniref:uncharacterized protein LOC123507575 n=1 Tax=Portunus trituberculatus TaxID=210409 RepID=UPI001E1CF620|nr:uncharacterized protein LOC123507575 [Portunus trituberculatus]
MSASPSLRLSLRRKRSTRSGENSGSPAIKKSSPKLPEARKEPPSTPKTHTSRTANRPSRSALRTSPRLSREKSRDSSDNEEKNLKTPVSTKWMSGNEESLRQPSPDMPFLSSQLCGTQDCEVVWDCDSPGFSKDDLKRMHSGDEGEKAVIAIPAPPRQLFPHSRTRPSKAASLGNTTAQLNDLLDLLSSKGKEKRKNESEGDPDRHSLQQIIPPRDSCSEDSSASELIVLPVSLRDASSQPFQVPGVSGPKSTDHVASSNDLNDSVWGDDLNLGMCDINDTRRSNSEGVGAVKNQLDNSRLSSEKAELSSASVDIFDDDLFSESVILSTQAVEEEALNTNNHKDITNKCYSGGHYSKDPQQKFSKHNVKGEENSRNINSDENISKNNKSELNNHSKLSTSGLSTHSLNINQRSSSSDSSPQRQVRRSFRFGLSPTNTAKSNPPAVTGNTRHTLVNIPETQKFVKIKDTRCETKKMNLLPAFNHEKPSALNKNLMDRTSKTSIVESSPCPQGTLPTIRKPLFGHDVKAEEAKNRSVQGTRGPLLRSQSIGNARLATSSPMARRSNSSMELDTSQELEDDDFFKSILSMLPEDDECIVGDATLSLSPITSETKPTQSSSSKNSLIHARLAVESKMSQGVKSSNDRKLTNSTSLQNKVSNGSVRSLVVGQVNMCPGATNSKAHLSGRTPAANVQGLKPSGTNYSTAKTKPLDTREPNASSTKEQQSGDTFDDGLFQDDVLSLIDEVESQFGSQNAPSPTPSPQSQPQQTRCTQDEIARKKAAALQRREAKRRQQCR